MPHALSSCLTTQRINAHQPAHLFRLVFFPRINNFRSSIEAAVCAAAFGFNGGKKTPPSILSVNILQFEIAVIYRYIA